MTKHPLIGVMHVIDHADDRAFCAAERWAGAGTTPGKMLAKKNTLTDFVACARHLAKTGWTSSERLVAEGGSPFGGRH